MTISVNPVEAIWLGSTGATFVLTLLALLDARSDLAAVRSLNGHIRGIIARGNVRAESLRLVVQAILLGIAVPSLFTDREATLTPGIVALMAVPIILLVNSAYAYRDRQRIAKRIALDQGDDR